MKHPSHGFHHAYNTLEEETMRKNGWVDDVPTPAAEVAQIAEVPDEQEAPAEEAKRGPGRPRKS